MDRVDELEQQLALIRKSEKETERVTRRKIKLTPVNVLLLKILNRACT